MNSELVMQYKVKIEALFPLAKKAYGSRKQDTPAHRASREYTRLLVEFSSLGGNVPELARVLKVAYPGVRRRIIMEKVFISDIIQERTADKSELPNAIERIKTAKENGGSVFYHNQLTKEYINGFSLQDLAKGLGLNSAAPLYYGVQRSLNRASKI